AISFQDGVFVVGVPTTFAKAHLEGRFAEPLCAILADITGTKVEIQFVVTKEPPALNRQTPQATEYRTSKRSYRMGKGRITAALRERGLANIAATAMNSMASVIPQANVHRSAKQKRLQDEVAPDEHSIGTEPSSTSLFPLAQPSQERVDNIAENSPFVNNNDS